MRQTDLKKIVKLIIESVLYELEYTDIGHKEPQNVFLWAYKDNVLKKVPRKKFKDHGIWWNNTRDSIIFRADFVGRFDGNTKICSLGKPGITKTSLEEVPQNLINQLKFEFGDDIRIKAF